MLPAWEWQEEEEEEEEEGHRESRTNRGLQASLHGIWQVHQTLNQRRNCQIPRGFSINS